MTGEADRWSHGPRRVQLVDRDDVVKPIASVGSTRYAERNATGGDRMTINDDDITIEPGADGEGVADGGANPVGHDGGADGSAAEGEGVADGGANPGGHDGGADGSAAEGEGVADGGANPEGHDGGADGSA
jgi:hypothetical protein